MPSTSCPEAWVLEQLLDDSLDPRRRGQFERHLQDCDICQAQLERMSGDEPDWPRRVRDLDVADEAESPGLKRVIGHLKDEFGSRREQAGRRPVEHPDEVLAFLDPPAEPGDLGMLGPYRVQEVLGQGGMGIVLRAFDPGLNRPIAIKVLAPQLATSGAARVRFSREARAAAAIRDEHVVAIHAVDEWKGLPYLVMEFIPGISLQDRLDHSAPLDVSSILRIGMQTARGLAAAHAQGLVHRDIKPSNILLENGVERVKLTDFGLARAVDDASLTQSGVVAGTPLYMAPEQALGEAVDPRADLFSLGAVMYAMSTGRPPFRASSTLGVLRRVCDDEHRPIQEVNPEIPAWLAEIIDRLLAKSPRDRFQGAGDVARILGERLAQRQRGPSVTFTAHQTSAPRPVAGIEDVGPAKGGRSRRRRWIWAAASLSILLSTLFALRAMRSNPRWLDSAAAALGFTPPTSQLLILRDPRLRIVVDGRDMEHKVIPNTHLLQVLLSPGWHHVEGYEGSRKIEGYRVSIRPGRSLNLHFKARLGAQTSQAGTEGAWRDTPPFHLGSLTGDQEHELQFAQRRLDAAVEKAAEQEKRAANARERLSQGRLSRAAADVEARLLDAANLDVVEATSALITARRKITGDDARNEAGKRERIVALFKADPEVKKLIEDIIGTEDQIEKLKRIVSSKTDPALVNAQLNLAVLTQRYEILWQTKSEELKFLVRDPVLDLIPRVDEVRW